MRSFLIFCLVILFAGPAVAQQRYSQWGNAETGQKESVQQFVDELRRLVDEADKARAADPRFLRDLRDLAARFDRPWRKPLLSDRFRDGNFTADPAWTVTAGRFWIEKGWGLRSSVLAAKPETSSDNGGKTSGEDVALAILRGVLSKQNGSQESASDQARETSADIHTDAAITNAFSMDLELASWQPDGHLEFGVYQGKERAAGYRLVYASGRRLELHRVTRWGASIVDSSRDPLTLEDKQAHRIAWTRAADGTMVVSVDGKEVIHVVDRGYRDPFSGFRLINGGGDFTLRRIDILGTS